MCLSVKTNGFSMFFPFSTKTVFFPFSRKWKNRFFPFFSIFYILAVKNGNSIFTIFFPFSAEAHFPLNHFWAFSVGPEREGKAGQPKSPFSIRFQYVFNTFFTSPGRLPHFSIFCRLPATGSIFRFFLIFFSFFSLLYPS